MDSKENYYNIKQMTESFRNVKKYSQHSNTIVDMFVEITQKLDKSSKDYLSKVIPIDDEKSTLNQVDTIIIMNYFKQIVVYLIKTKVELEEKTQQIEPQTQYETLIQKLEADVRQHIRIEQQLRIYTETLQQKIDDFISEREQQIQLIKEYEQQIKQKNKDIVIYQSELRKAVNQNQQKHTKLVTEPIHEEYDTTYHKNKLNQTNYTHQRKPSQLNEEKSVPNKSQINSYKNSPERIPIRKISVTNYAETKAIKQPVFIRQPCPMSYSHLKTETQISYRSNSQESKYLQKNQVK
ncbi:unnamed protein product (macronuclear) [Paramecium tetraurelia]|uniref:Cilium assembly protein DZIP1 N-terminal domain-containing protein n=1 Tax=Paramecium tetraurelia TaxID=5888 RepID=A0DPX5_PARTE|nr:uncharacterized protein GSPATT00002491001 [Paramecium tetraurelia]CAK85092.1 unnamed protein product [Paramecium tetraurelia]|eukprot:XP_001452489.1 hypothetical protein (macronuclear) [Paramecium tetraurelia strain d4-2]